MYQVSEKMLGVKFWSIYWTGMETPRLANVRSYEVVSVLCNSKFVKHFNKGKLNEINPTGKSTKMNHEILIGHDKSK